MSLEHFGITADQVKQHALEYKNCDYEDYLLQLISEGETSASPITS